MYQLNLRKRNIKVSFNLLHGSLKRLMKAEMNAKENSVSFFFLSFGCFSLQYSGFHFFSLNLFIYFFFCFSHVNLNEEKKNVLRISIGNRGRIRTY